VFPGIAEIGGLDEEDIEFERQAFEGVGFPGIGLSAEVDESFEHRLCSKCEKMELRAGVAR
jgi:hypothetical protein